MGERKNTYVIGIDGMQGSGKSEHLELLAKSYTEAGAQVLICKGSGSRTGTGEESSFFYNPPNQYRQDFHMRHYAKNTSNDLLGPLEDREQAISVLNKELLDILKTQQHDIVLLDRSILTIYSLALQKSNSISFNDMMSYYEKTYAFTPYLPDSLIALIVNDTEILEKRVKNRGTYAHIKQEILKKTPDFMNAVSKFNNEISISTHFTIIDCAARKDQIHQAIIQRLNTIPGNPFVLQSKI